MRARFVFIFLFFGLETTLGLSTSCCPTKVLTGASARAGTYYYHETRDLSTISQDCKNGCVYTKEGQAGKYCFAVGTLSSECIYDVDGMLLISSGWKKDQSYKCSITLPVNVGTFTPGGIAVLDGKINIYNGNGNRCFSGSLESVDAWVETKTCFGPARLFPSMTTVGQYIFMTGGQNKNNNKTLNLIERYNGTAWETLDNRLKSRRYAHCSIAISDTEMIVVGGKDTTVLATMEKYNYNGDLVETMTSMDIARSGLGCACYNEEVYAAGGNIDSVAISDVEVYNLNSKLWRKIKNMKTVRNFPGLHVFMGQLTVVGGDSSSIEVYNGSTWEITEQSLDQSFDKGVSVPVKCPA